MVQLLQQWLSLKGKSVNLAVSGGLPSPMSLEELDSDNPKECLSSKIDELASECEGKQAESKRVFLSCPFLWGATRRCGPDLQCVFLQQMIQLRETLTIVPNFLGFG